MQADRGFTLLEQALVIASVGALSALAVPRLVATQEGAQTLALPVLARTLGTQMLINRSVCLLPADGANEGRCVVLSDCAEAARLLAHPLPPMYRLLPRPLPTGEAAAQGAECEVAHRTQSAREGFRGYATAAP